MSSLSSDIERIALSAVAERLGHPAPNALLGVTQDPDDPNAAILHVDTGINALACIAALELAGLTCLPIGRDQQEPYGAWIQVGRYDPLSASSERTTETSR